MNPIRIRPTPASPFHRYAPEEMSGPLPAVLYKVLSANYARRLVDDGEMMWSTLAWFQNDEDVGRGDDCEGTDRYFPISGLDVNRLERAGRADNKRIILPRHGMVSRAAQSNHIFIYSMTLDSTLDIGGSSDRACVDIFEPGEFLRRVHAAVQRHSRLRVATLIHDTVRYYDPADPPAELWALPDRLTMHKRAEPFKCQQEYRLAVGTRPSVFDFENVECFIVDEETKWPRLKLDPQAHRMKLRIGHLGDCCRVR